MDEREREDRYREKEDRYIEREDRYRERDGGEKEERQLIILANGNNNYA